MERSGGTGPGTRARREDVAIFCGPARSPWSPHDLADSGLGGSETAAVRIAEGLAARGYRTAIYAEGPPAELPGFSFRHWSEFDPSLPRTAVACWRFPELFDRPLNASVRMLWSAEPGYGNRMRPGRAAAIDHVLTLSEWHDRRLARAYPYLAAKLVRSRTGIDHARFEGPERARRRRVLYTSAPNRGLDVLLDLWPRIRAAVPDAELAYTYAAPYRAVAGEVPGHPFGNEIRRRAAQPGVVALGTVPGRLYPDLLREGMVWAHPSWSSERNESYIELSCIAAAEAQAAGLHVVASAFAALPETVRCGDLVRARPLSLEWQERFVESIVAGLTDPAVQDHARAAAPAAVADMTWEAATDDLVALIERRPARARTVVARPARECGARLRPASPRLPRRERRRLARAHKRELRRRARRLSRGGLTRAQEAQIAATATTLALLGAAATPPGVYAAPTVTVSPQGVIDVVGTSDADFLELNCGFGVVTADTTAADPNDFSPVAGSPACSSITDLNAVGNGGSDDFDFSRVTVSNGFTNPALASAVTQIVGSPDGNDAMRGTGFNDDIGGGGGGTDTVHGGPTGTDTLAEFYGGVGPLTLAPGSLSGPGISVSLVAIDDADISTGAGDDVLDASAWNRDFVFQGGIADDTLIPPVLQDPNDVAIYLAGPGTDTVLVQRNFGSLLLTDSALSGQGAPIGLNGVERGNFTGGASGNVLDAAAFHGRVDFRGEGGNDQFWAPADPNDAGTFDGGLGRDLVCFVGSGAFTVTDSLFAGPLGSQVLANVEHLGLTGSPLADSLDAAAFGGRVLFTGLGGDDELTLPSAPVASPDPNDVSDFQGGLGNDTVVKTADQDFVLSPGLLASPGGATLDGVERAELFGGPSANRFDFGAWTGGGEAFGGAGGDTFTGPSALGGLPLAFRGEDGDDVFEAGGSAAGLFGGPGMDVFRARNGVMNEVSCGDDAGNVLDIDPNDTATGCLTAAGGGGDTAPAPEPSPTLSPPPLPSPSGDLPLFTFRVPGTVTVRNGIVVFTVSCPPARPGGCPGTGVLRVTVPVNTSAVRRRALTIGTVRFNVPSGTTRTVRLRLTRKGLATLRRAKRLRAKLIVSVRDTRGAATRKSRSVLLKLPARRRS